MVKELNNIALCYHGITSNIKEKSKYTTYIEDFKEQINHLENLGYMFIKPSMFYKRYNSIIKSSSPYATIIFDDGLNSVRLATRWLAMKSIPFGIAVIGQRLCKLDPEDDYVSWKDINTAINSGFCEILHHSYDLHHLCLIQNGENITNSPIFNGPCFVDHGDFIYISPTDKRIYWDMSHINNISWSFPLFGTDIKTGKVIKSKVLFKGSRNILADRIRVWSCLHNPQGAGYSAKVQISINGILVAESVLVSNDYEDQKKWPEREFTTILFKNKYEIMKGEAYEIEFTTQNTGDASFMIYTIPDFTGDFKLTTSCTEMTIPENMQWPARACIILADGTGKTVSNKEFQSYIKQDIEKNNQVIKKYLNASWRTITTGYEESNNLSTVVLGGTYTNGQLATTKIKIHAVESFAAEILRIKYASRLGNEYPLIIDIMINDTKVGSFESNWWDWHSQEILIDSYNFMEGNDYIIKFVTKNASPYGQGLLRGYMDQPKSPHPIWNPKINKIVVPLEKEFEHKSLYEVINPEGTDVYPDDAMLSNESSFNWVVYEPYDGPGKVFLDILSCSSEKVKIPTQICYPFGRYASTIITSKLLPDKEDIASDLYSVLTEEGIKSGYSIWNNPVKSLKNANLSYSKAIIPRYLVEGNMDQTKIIQNIDILIGHK